MSPLDVASRPVASYSGHLVNLRTGPDVRPIRTKIVATIGDPDNHRRLHDKEGRCFFNLDLEEIEPEKLTRIEMVRELYLSGVDIVRLNCSHVKPPGVVQEIYREIKRGILECEGEFEHAKRMAVLADLPGPKIRFDLGKHGISLHRGDRFDVNLGREEVPGANTVLVDDRSLQEAMASEFFSQLMETIERRLHSKQDVRVFVGDGDPILAVQPTFDPQRPVLPCVVISEPAAPLKGSRGFTLKGVDLDVPSFTETDRKLLGHLLDEEYGSPDELVLAFVALSFAQTDDDILSAREFIERKLIGEFKCDPKQARLQSPSLIAKIETRKGHENSDAILDVADGAMVARGDLGLQMEIEEVPRIQKALIRLCNERGKPVITATQMLASMTYSIEPTRAEVTDVFNAIQDGTDAVMTSEETAIGSYPMHTIRKMLRIAEEAERFFELESLAPQRRRELRRQRFRDFLKEDSVRIRENERRIEAGSQRLGRKWATLASSSGGEGDPDSTLRWRRDLFAEKLEKAQKQATTNRVTEAACDMAEAESARAILAASTSGRTVRMISRIRPRVVIIGAAHDVINTRKLAVSYGVIPICVGAVDPGRQGTEDLFLSCSRAVCAHPFLTRFVGSERDVIFSAGFPLQKPGTTNLLQIRRIECGG